MKNLQFIHYQRGASRDGFKKSKPIPTLSHGVDSKFCPIPSPPPLQGGENLRGVKWGGAKQNYQPYLGVLTIYKKKYTIKEEE